MAESDAPDLSQRKQPRQDRSRERVARILDIASRLVAQRGTAGLKTSEIAREAGISLASLYRYFPNKEAIIKAIAERHIEKLDQHMKAFAGTFDLEQGLDRLIETYAHFYRTEPGYKEIWAGVEASPELISLDLRELESNANDLAQAAAKHFPAMDETQLRRICLMLPRACGAVLRLSMTMPEEDAAGMVDELKCMVRSYLRARLRSLGDERSTPSR